MAAPDGGAGDRRCLAYAAHLHAQVVGFQVDGHAVGVQHGLQRIGDLLPDPLLDREAPRKEPHQAGQLGNADDVLVGDVTDIGRADRRERRGARRASKKGIGPSSTWLRRQSGSPWHSVSKTRSSLGSPS